MKNLIVWLICNFYKKYPCPGGYRIQGFTEDRESESIVWNTPISSSGLPRQLTILSPRNDMRARLVHFITPPHCHCEGVARGDPL
jgi:hypothetical protein